MKILIVEDIADDRRLLRYNLEHHGCDVVIEAADGEDAVRKFMANRDRIQLLLFDIIMPKKNGKKAYEEIKKITPDIKVIFTSGYAPELVRQKASLENDAPLIYKPMSPMKLLQKVRSVLDGSGS